MIRLRIIVVFVFTSVLTFAQEQHIADSLLNTIANIKVDSIRIKKIIEFTSIAGRSCPDLALILCKELKRQSLEANYQSGIGDAYNIFGILASERGEHKKAKENYLNALKIYQRVDNNYGMVNINNNLGLLELNQNNYVNALDYFLQALNILKSYDNQHLLGLIYSNLGKLYIEINNHKKANECLKQAEEICVNLDIKENLVYVYSMLGFIAKKNNKEDALYYHNKCLKLSQTINNAIMESNANREIGLILFEDGKYDLALKHYTSSLEIAKELRNYTSIIRTLTHLGYYHYYLNDFDKAKTCNLEALVLSNETNFKEGMKNAALHLSYIYQDLGNYEKAYDYRSQYGEIHRSIHSTNTIYAITEFNNKIEQERIKYESQIELHSRKIKNLIILLVLVILMSLFVTLYLFQKRVTKNAIQKEDDLNIELTSITLFLLRKNEILNKIRKKLKKKRDQFIEENQLMVKKIMTEVRLAQNKEAWKEFELYFNRVHKNFHKSLNKKFPDLTIKEKRLCSLLRINMDTKDISLVTQQKPQSITIARSRLRKKLGIANQKTSLYTFLAQY